MRKLFTMMFILLATISVAEGRENPTINPPAYPIPVVTKPWRTEVLPMGWTQVGKASFYGIGDGSGTRTASGAHFNPSALTAAHSWLPFGTVVRVTVIDTGKSRDILINDRVGPAVRANHRVLDLSDGAARSLGIHKDGVAVIRLQVIRNPT